MGEASPRSSGKSRSKSEAWSKGWSALLNTKGELSTPKSVPATPPKRLVRKFPPPRAPAPRRHSTPAPYQPRPGPVRPGKRRFTIAKKNDSYRSFRNHSIVENFCPSVLTFDGVYSIGSETEPRDTIIEISDE